MRFETKDCTYSYAIEGKGETILLLHGFTGSQQTWKSLKKVLRNDFQVITIDLPGHGKTIGKPRNMKECVKDLSNFLKEIKVEQAHVIGYSMGGRVALSFAMMHKKQVASLILEGSSPGLKTESERRNRRKLDKQLAQRLRQEGLEAFVSYWENIPLFSTQRRLPEEVQEKIRNERLSQRIEGLADSLVYMGTGAQPSWWSSLKECSIPTKLIVGELDQKFVHINKEMQQLMPRAELTIIEDAGHAPHIERPVVFHDIVKAFLHKQLRRI